MAITLHPPRSQDLDRALKATDEDLEALRDIPDDDLDLLSLLASWSPIARLAGTPVGFLDHEWYQPLVLSSFGSPDIALRAARNRVGARRWLGHS